MLKTREIVVTKLLTDYFRTEISTIVDCANERDDDISMFIKEFSERLARFNTFGSGILSLKSLVISSASSAIHRTVNICFLIYRVASFNHRLELNNYVSVDRCLQSLSISV